MPDIWMDVDTAVTIPVNKVPIVASSDGFTTDETIAWNESGMDLNWNFVTTAGVQTQTNVVPTTAGEYDWTHVGNAMYKIEMTASGGASADNDTEGFGWFSGNADAICPFAGPTIGFRKASMNNVMINNGTLQDNLENKYDGTGYVGGTAVSKADLTKIGGDAQSATDLKDFADVGYDPTNNVTQSDLIYIHGTALTETDGQLAAAFIKLFNVGTPLLVASSVMRGTDGANTTVPDASGTAATPGDVATALTNIDLDHLISASVADEVADNSIIAKLVSKDATADWSDFSWQTESLEALKDGILADILADTGELQTDDYPTSIAGIKTVVDDLDTLTKAAGDGDLAAIKVITDALTAAGAAKLALGATTMITGIVSWDNTNATTTVIYSSDITEATADHFNGRLFVPTSGALVGQYTDITDYALDTGEGKFTVTAMTEAPADNITFVIL